MVINNLRPKPTYPAFVQIFLENIKLLKGFYYDVNFFRIIISKIYVYETIQKIAEVSEHKHFIL